MKLEADHDACVGSGNCVMISDALFDQDDDGIVVLLAAQVPAAEEDHAREAVRVCPAAALRLQ